MIKDNWKETFEIDELINDIKRKDAPQRYCLFIFGVFLSALTFNVFFSKNDIVTGGSAGLSIIFNHLYGIDESKFVLCVSLILLIFSFFLLGFKKTLKTTIGTLLYPLFMKITSYLLVYINIESSSFLLLMLYGGILSGFSTGIIMKTGFTTGGFNILYQIVHKYFKTSIGNASLILNSFVLISASLIFGVPKAIYAIIALFISSFVTDRVLLGISKNKTFYIVTDKEKEIKEYILQKLNHGVTVLNAKGGYSNDKKKMLMCVIPTNEYFELKEIVLKIDKNAFFLITDSYETEGAI